MSRPRRGGTRRRRDRRQSSARRAQHSLSPARAAAPRPRSPSPPRPHARPATRRSRCRSRRPAIARRFGARACPPARRAVVPAPPRAARGSVRSRVPFARCSGSILTRVGDLFQEAAGRQLEAAAPLAQRLRPAVLDRFVGQEHVVGPGRALRLAIEADRVPSLVLYGPPGTGKTTLARIVAGVTGSEFEELSAVSATVANVREVLARAR